MKQHLRDMVDALRAVAFGYGPLYAPDTPSPSPLLKHLPDGNRQVPKAVTSLSEHYHSKYYKARTPRAER